MADVTLTTPRIRVVLDHDGTLTEYTVQTDNRDAVRWDMTRGRENWPAGDQAPMLWSTFIAWSAMNRAGDYVGKFTDFNDRCLEARPATGSDGDDEVGPTPEGHEPI